MFTIMNPFNFQVFICLPTDETLVIKPPVNPKGVTSLTHRQNNTSFTSASILVSTAKKTLFILFMLFSLLPAVEAETLVASVLTLEGDAVKIVCPTMESYESYFWRKGDSIKDSTEVASFVGVPRAISENYAVTSNGTLCIQNVTLKDEGNYFCRGVSDISSSTTEIMVQVQASLQNFALSIDHCSTESSSCSRNIHLSKPIELMCRAQNASPSMTLKWFNGSKEIESNITVVKDNMNDAPSSTMIISTLKAVYRTPVTLTCEAVDTKSRTDGGRFVNIRLEQPVAITNEKSPTNPWCMIVVVTCTAIIVCITGIVYKLHGRICTTTG